MKQIIKFLCNLNGVFAPKSPLDNPELAEMYASIMKNPCLGRENDKKSLRSDMVLFGNDFKKATNMAKEMLGVK